MVLPLRWPFTYLQRLHAHLGAGNPAVGPATETVTPARDPREEEEDEDIEDNSSVTEEKMTKVGNWQEGFFFVGRVF